MRMQRPNPVLTEKFVNAYIVKGAPLTIEELAVLFDRSETTVRKYFEHGYRDRKTERWIHGDPVIDHTSSRTWGTTRHNYAATRGQLIEKIRKLEWQLGEARTYRAPAGVLPR